MAVIDFGMLVDINELLKKENIEYSLHSLGGCAMCGVELRQDGKKTSIDKIVQLINTYLENKKMYLVKTQQPLVFHVHSIWEK